jgi:hypothetical protein
MNDNTSGHRAPPGQQRDPDTRLVTAGRDPKSNHGFVNPPVWPPWDTDHRSAQTRVTGPRGSAGVAVLPSGLAALADATL